MASPRSITVYDTPSGLSGSFTVSIDREIDPETVAVRVWYGRATPQGWQPWRDWDGYLFTKRPVPGQSRGKRAGARRIGCASSDKTGFHGQGREPSDFARCRPP